MCLASKHVRLCVHICSERLTTSVQAFYQFLEGSLLNSHALRGPSIFKALKVNRFSPKTSTCVARNILARSSPFEMPSPLLLFFQQKDFTKDFIMVSFFLI